MTVGPEVVLANECCIPVACIVTGHKYSLQKKVKENETPLAMTLGELHFLFNKELWAL
jgi:hypothetical protein